MLPLEPPIEPLELPVVPAAPLAPLAPLLAPPAPPPPPPPPCANAPELSASAATNESAKILARDMLELHVGKLNAMKKAADALIVPAKN